jgi:transcriptional regulator with XRE-family HTH domain
MPTGNRSEDEVGAVEAAERRRAMARLGEELARRRAEANLNKKQLAERVGMSLSYISGAEGGHVWASRKLVAAYERELNLGSGTLTSVYDALARFHQRTRAGGVLHGDMRPENALVARPPAGASPALVLLDADEIRLVGPGEQEAGPDNTPIQVDLDTATAVRGLREAWGAAAALLASWERRLAADPDAALGQRFLFTSLGRQRPWDRTERASAAWHAALRGLLAAGIDVLHICRLPEAPEEREAFVTPMLGLVGLTGTYEAFYLPHAARLAAPYELLVGPDTALFLLAVSNSYLADAAAIVRDPDQVQMLHDHVLVLRSQARPILKMFENASPLQLLDIDGRHPVARRFSDTVTEAEQRPGDRLRVKRALSMSTVPPPLYRAWARRVLDAIKHGREGEPTLVETVVQNKELRDAVFHEQVLSHRFYNICTKRAVTAQFLDGEYDKSDWMQRWLVASTTEDEERGPTEEERLRHLHNVIRQLESYDNFRIALLDDDEVERLKPLEVGSLGDAYWMVKGMEGDAVLLFEAWPQPDQEVGVEISEPATVEWYRARFWEHWSAIRDENKSRDGAIRFLLGLKEQLEQRVADGGGLTPGQRV